MNLRMLNVGRVWKVYYLYKILKLFKFYSNNSIYLVAVQCLETAYEVSLANTHNDGTYGPPINLLSLVSDTSTTTTTHSTNFSSWFGAVEQPVKVFCFYYLKLKVYFFVA